MKKMGIIYGSSTGTCESIAQTIAEKLGVASVDVIDASKITTEKVESYDLVQQIKIDNREDALNLLKMTPHYYHIKKEKRHVLETLQNLNVTIDVKFTIYRTEKS